MPRSSSTRSYAYRPAGIVASLRESGLDQGDNPFISSSFGMIGRLTDDRGGAVTDIDAVCAAFLSAIETVIGPQGTVFAPAYSYTIGANTADSPAVFDPVSTPAAIGPFPNFLLRRPGARRNADPMVSVVGKGPAAAAVLDNAAPTSYGRDSVFERLLNLPRSKVCNIGLGPNWTPFIHYADFLAGVPFRYDKLFAGWLQEAGGRRPIRWLYQVPARLPEATANAHSSGAAAHEAGIFASAPLGRARIFTAPYRAYFTKVRTSLETDPWLQATGPAVDLLMRESDRTAARPGDVPQPTAVISVAQDAILDAVLSAGGGLEELARPTGAAIYDWVVPERYAVRQAEIRAVDGVPETAPRLLPYAPSTVARLHGQALAERLGRRRALRGPVWIWRDWAFDAIDSLDPRALYDIAIDVDTGMGLLRAGLRTGADGDGPLLVLDTASDPAGAPSPFARLCVGLTQLCPDDAVAAAPGDLGAALALQASGRDPARGMIRIRRAGATRQDPYGPAGRCDAPWRDAPWRDVLGCEALPGGLNPAAAETMPLCPVATVRAPDLESSGPGEIRTFLQNLSEARAVVAARRSPFAEVAVEPGVS